jgi:poly-gamma-glutamate synthesis protein (capsule biosynthesis protein)
MSPANVGVLAAAGIGCCVLANNHVLDWGHPGLLETLDTLGRAGIAVAGAGRTVEEAVAPAVLRVRVGRVIVLAAGSESAGVPADWAAGTDRAGVDVLGNLSRQTTEAIAARIARVKRPGDVVVASLHWGSNWGYDIPPGHRRFAHELIDVAGVDVVHGHSSHHARGLELYAGRLILYGCGDFITDYEGIGGREEFRGDLVLAYFPRLEAATGRLLSLTMTPFQLRRFQLVQPSPADAAWLCDRLDRHSRPLGTGVQLETDGTFTLR